MPGYNALTGERDLSLHVSPKLSTGTSASSVSSGSTGNWFVDAFNKGFSTAGNAMASPYQTTPLTAAVTNPPTDSSMVGHVSTEGEAGSLDPSGYDQAQWEYERQLELLAEQRAYNSAEAEKQRQWQERMSNTAYQRAVEDLESAGLNKWLAVTGGNGASASTPSGASASSSAGDASSPNPSIYKAMLQYLQAIMTSTIKLVDFF